MNVHFLLDYLTVQIAALLTGKNKFFTRSIESPTFKEHLDKTFLQLPEFELTGQYEIPAETLAGRLDPAFQVVQWQGENFPTIIYHHGNNERPFDFRKLAKNTFRDIFLSSEKRINANLIVLRAPFHNSSSKEYQQKMTELSNFTAMIAVSVKLVEQLVGHLKNKYKVFVCGISLGGWVTNLHRAYFNTADGYIPLLAGAALDDVFLTSIYRKLTGKRALENQEVIRKILNFEDDFEKVKKNNVFPLQAFYDGIIRFEPQKRSYGAQFVNIIEKGHVTAALAPALLRRHIEGVMETVCNKRIF